MKRTHSTKGSRAHVSSLPRATSFAHTHVITPTLDRTGTRHPVFKPPGQTFGGGLTTKHEHMNDTIKVPRIYVPGR